MVQKRPVDPKNPIGCFWELLSQKKQTLPGRIIIKSNPGDEFSFWIGLGSQIAMTWTLYGVLSVSVAFGVLGIIWLNFGMTIILVFLHQKKKATRDFMRFARPLPSSFEEFHDAVVSLLKEKKIEFEIRSDPSLKFNFFVDNHTEFLFPEGIELRLYSINLFKIGAVSVAYLGSIERFRTPESLGLLWRITEVLKTQQMSMLYVGKRPIFWERSPRS